MANIIAKATYFTVKREADKLADNEGLMALCDLMMECFTESLSLALRRSDVEEEDKEISRTVLNFFLNETAGDLHPAIVMFRQVFFFGWAAKMNNDVAKQLFLEEQDDNEKPERN